VIGSSVKFTDETAKVVQAAKDAGELSMGRAAGRIRKDSIASIKRAPKAKAQGRNTKGQFTKARAATASPPGSAPYTKRGQLKRAIVYDVNKADQSAVIGPRASVVGLSAEAHEFGGTYKGSEYPERPFMGPALDKNIGAFAQGFSGTIGQ
jgi:phage gpG-like protein